MSDNMTTILGPDELDAIGEIMNISMGSAATAISTMLEKQVVITTPKMQQNLYQNIDSSSLEPALIVRIKYTKGIEGTNTTMLRRRDMQIILSILMGSDMPTDDEDFEFDDMSMSAACEVMNQMMGASATALSETLGMPIDISTPEAILVENTSEADEEFLGIRNDEEVVAISFNLTIKDVLDTIFSCFLPVSLAARIVNHVTGGMEEEPMVEEIPQPTMGQPTAQPQAPAAIPDAPAAAMAPPPTPAPVTPPPEMPQAAAPQPQAAPPVPPQPAPSQPEMMQVPPMQPPAQQAYTPQGMQPQPMQPQGMPPQYMQQPYYGQPPQYGYGQPPQGYPQSQPQVAVTRPDFPDFSQQVYQPGMPSGSNMDLLMGVQLEVSVIIGRTKRKIKDIIGFGQGTVVELEQQTGAPAEIVVNGQLLAYGDVIVVGDNFGVRITEIVGSKELMDSLGNN